MTFTRLRGLALLALVSLSLASCSSVTKVADAVQGLTITQGQIDAARSAYIGLYLTPAAAYRCVSFNADKTCNPRPICADGQTFLKDQCATRDAVKKIQGTTATLSKALNDLQAQYSAGNNTGLYAAYVSLQAAITAATGLITTFESN